MTVEKRTRRRGWAAASAAIVGCGTWLLEVPDAFAAPIPNPPADASAPGAVLVGTVLGWLKWAGLASALAGLLIGAISMGVGHFGSNYSASSAGRKWLMGGMGAAILSGLAWTIATTLYTATAP
ncbi:MAG: hypothetical protein AAB131_09065 [Actinomycetota bacterium]